MNIVSAATRAVTKTADVTTATAGAIGGAAVSGVAGALQGAASGVRTGLDSGSRSSAAAAITLGAIGAAGLIEWPVLLTVGGAALVVHRLGHRNGSHVEPPVLRSVPITSDESAAKPTARTATKSTRNSSRSAKKATPRRPTTK